MTLCLLPDLSCLAFFDQQQHTLTLPTVSSVTYVLRFLEKLCHNLHCDPLFGSQPVARGGLHYDSHTYNTGQCYYYHTFIFTFAF